MRSLIGGHFLETEIAQSIPKELDSQGGILIGGGSEPRAGEVKDRWQVVYTTVFEDTYVRVDPATGGSAGYTFFDIGAIADLVQVKNTLWHQFGGANQTRYADRGVRRAAVYGTRRGQDRDSRAGSRAARLLQLHSAPRQRLLRGLQRLPSL